MSNGRWEIRNETMSEKEFKTYTSEELAAMEARGEDKTDWDALARMKDEDIDCSDIPALDDDFWANAKLIIPKPNVLAHQGKDKRKG